MDTPSFNMLPDPMVVCTLIEIDTQEAQSQINTKNPYRQKAEHLIGGLHEDVAEDLSTTLAQTQDFNPHRKARANRRRQPGSTQQLGKQPRLVEHDAHCVLRRDSTTSFRHDKSQSASSIATGN